MFFVILRNGRMPPSLFYIVFLTENQLFKPSSPRFDG
jgi:hypothetical protein